MTLSLSFAREVFIELLSILNTRQSTIKPRYDFNGNIIQRLIDEMLLYERQHQQITIVIEPFIQKLSKLKYYHSGQLKYSSYAIDKIRSIMKQISLLSPNITRDQYTAIAMRLYNKYILPTATRYRISTKSRKVSNNSNTPNTGTANWKKEDKIMFYVMYIVEKCGIIESTNIVAFTKENAKKVWDVLNFTQKNDISFDSIWNRFKNKSIIRSIPNNKRKYVLNKPQFMETAKQQLKTTNLLKHLEISETARLTNNSLNAVQHVICINITLKIKEMGYNIQWDIIKQAIESEGHNFDKVNEYIVKMNKSKRKPSISSVNIESLSLDRSEKEEIEQKSKSDYEQSPSVNRKTRKRKKIYRDAQPLFEDSDDFLDLSHEDLTPPKTKKRKINKKKNKQISQHQSNNTDNTMDNCTSDNINVYVPVSDDDDVLNGLIGNENHLRINYFYNDKKGNKNIVANEKSITQSESEEETIICPDCTFENNAQMSYCELCNAHFNFG